MFSTNTWEYLSITFVFHEKRFIRELRFKQKSDFLIKNRAFAFSFHYFYREFSDSLASGGTLPPPVPFNFCY